MLSRIYDRHLSPVGINISQFALLSHIDRAPGIGANGLGREMAMERTTLLRALKPLRTASLIDAIREGGTDLHYRLTQEGERKLHDARPFWEAAQVHYEGMFGGERAADLRLELLALTGPA